MARLLFALDGDLAVLHRRASYRVVDCGVLRDAAGFLRLVPGYRHLVSVLDVVAVHALAVRSELAVAGSWASRQNLGLLRGRTRHLLCRSPYPDNL